MQPLPESLPQSLADRYRLERELGRGGMATVYLAEDLKHRRPVAIKVLSPELAHAIGPERFRREIEIAARLNHPHIVPLHDSGALEPWLYYVMPFIEGESLRARIEREKLLAVENAIQIAHEIASALGHAHHRGLVHRDVKPENILLTEGIALLADFGIAHVMRSETTSLTQTGVMLGTPSYMAPEQITGTNGLDGRTDLYSLACVLYEMLAGSPPFGGSLPALVHQHLTVAPRPVTEVRGDVPSHVAEAMARALAKRPEDRFPTAAKFAEALGIASTRTAFFPAETIPTGTPNNLPGERTRFIGRAQDLAECLHLLDEARLLTLTGIGGSGKTRLALKVAEQRLPRYPDGVWFVDLAPLTEGNRVAETVAGVLGIREVAGRSLGDVLAGHVAGKKLLIVLDNCEHLLADTTEIADALLRAGKDVTLLATSREGLGVPGERAFPLRSLGVPAVHASTDLPAVEASEAVQLFVDRARLAVREFALTGANAPVVAEICRRLDGIPLAIELAAARVKILSVEQIRNKLDDRFRLLTGGSRTALARHQTLRATLQWSYDHLSAEEQRLLRQLAVFAGGWTLESAALVAGAGGDEFEVMDLLSRLADKSLIVIERGGHSGPRYGLLETVRHYILERTIEAGEADEARRRHCAEFLALAERAYSQRFVEEEAWGLRLETEHDNLRAALDLVRGTERPGGGARSGAPDPSHPGDPETYLELAGALGWFWQARSHLVEGKEHLRAAITGSSPDPPRPARARALWGMAHTMAWQGEAPAGLPWMEDSLRMWRALEDKNEIALALEGVGWMQLLGGDDESALATFEECLRLQEKLGDGHRMNRARVALGQVLVALAKVDEARAMALQIIAFSREHGDKRSEHLGWHYLADCALIEGTCADSLRLYRQSLILAQGIGDRLEMSFEVQGVAMSLAGLGREESALALAGAAKSEWGRIGADVHMRFWDALLERYLGKAREALGRRGERAWEAGTRLSFEEVMVMALDDSED